MELGNGFGVEKRHIITSLILIKLTKEFNSINFSSTIVYYDAYSIVNIIPKYGIMYTVSHLKSILRDLIIIMMMRITIFILMK